jgi:hypothetical protein
MAATYDDEGNYVGDDGQDSGQNADGSNQGLGFDANLSTSDIGVGSVVTGGTSDEDLTTTDIGVGNTGAVSDGTDNTPYVRDIRTFDTPNTGLAPGVFEDANVSGHYTDKDGNPVSASGAPLKYDDKGNLVDTKGAIVKEANPYFKMTGDAAYQTPKAQKTIGQWVKDFTSGNASAGAYAAAIAGLMGLSSSIANRKANAANQGYSTPIDMNKYKYTQTGIAAPVARKYGEGAVGQEYTTGSYTPPPAPPPIPAAHGGLMGLASGGRYLQGKTDGMADKINTDIDGKQAAKLSHGEFVIPADVVSHLGNGNSDAGADVLYKMMDRIRKARTGNHKQGKQINPNKFTPGGLASLPAYAAGGAIAFETGGTTNVTAPGSVSGTLSNWAAPYVTDMLSKGAALADTPYKPYTGGLTAGTSPLQTTAFDAASKLAVPKSMTDAAATAGTVATNMGNLNYTPTATATNQFAAPTSYSGSKMTSSNLDAAKLKSYMDLFNQASLNPQLEEAKRQAKIAQLANDAQAVKAGAFGGSGAALMKAENQRNLGTTLANITGTGYKSAYDSAMQQFNADQNRQLQVQQANEASRQFGAGQGMTAAQQAAQYGQLAQAQTAQQDQFTANYGLDALKSQLAAAQSQGQLGLAANQAGIANLTAQESAGDRQRAIEQAALDAQRKQYEEGILYPYKQLQFQQSLLSNLPIGSSTSTQTTSPFSDLTQGIGAILGINKGVNEAINPTPPAPK